MKLLVHRLDVSIIKMVEVPSKKSLYVFFSLGFVESILVKQENQLKERKGFVFSHI